MLTKADITVIVTKYGPGIAERYFTLKKTPVRMLSNAFLTFADHDRMNSSVAFIDISADKSGCCGFIFCKTGIHYGLESSKGFIDFSEVTGCTLEYAGNNKNEYGAVLFVDCGATKHVLDGRYAKEPLKRIVEEASKLCAARAEEAALEAAKTESEVQSAQQTEMENSAQAQSATVNESVELYERSEAEQNEEVPTDESAGPADEIAVLADEPKTTHVENTDENEAIKTQASVELESVSEASSQPETNSADNIHKTLEKVVPEAPQSEYTRKPTSAITTVEDAKRAEHFKAIREKAQRETAEIADIKSGRIPNMTECRAPVKPKPNPAPFGYTETVIAEMTISSNDITDVYMQDVIATTPNPDIYARSIEVIGSCMKKDTAITDERITAYLRENLSRITEVFLNVVQLHKDEIPPRTLHSIEVLDCAAKSMDRYIKQGDESTRRVMLFMCFQMMTYTDNIIQSEETKTVCLNFIKTFGTLGLILSMLDLELY